MNDTALALGAFAFASALYTVRYAYLVKFGRLGLLKPKLNWKPMKPDARALAIKSSLFVQGMQRIGGRSNKSATNDVYALVDKEMRALNELGLMRPDRSDDELRSEKKLVRFLELGQDDRSSPPTSELRDVRRKDVFLNLRERVDVWYAERASRAEAYEAWLAEVGDPDQSHLLKDGWIAFLKSLPGPDIRLWHGVATDFHELAGDRLDAAFWILQQDACDRATASDFIVGFLRFRLSEAYADYSRPDERLESFASVIEAFNSGRFVALSLQAGEHVGGGMSDDEAADILTKYEAALKLSGLPRPNGLLDSSVPPTHPANRGYNSPYAFSDDAGLHLAYPGPSWREAE
ncbi:hypothetical protein SLH49_09780 [Cognatiyoonia sp. IB215446]|uniref:hypothetical protein n=1 Tax=Cognatiyoonia sp. IB215446 TaxID=3097355 RepID=UPI002A11575B|nr:hypothetical protein [Cognatiyoonia sp. IB215446]MDX8348277.1 hypothetical protein [Cognatiyoonia sp. IB215446]